MKRITNQSGAALIEFILVLVPLLVLLFGSIEFGVAGYNKAMITNAAREGARAGAMFDAAEGPTYRLPDADVKDIAEKYCKEHVINFSLTDEPVAAVSTLTLSSGKFLKVNVDYNYGFLVLQHLIPGFSPSINLGAESVMRLEYQN
jgi:Flp pilus assembly protein TadG